MPKRRDIESAAGFCTNRSSLMMIRIFFFSVCCLWLSVSHLEAEEGVVPGIFLDTEGTVTPEGQQTPLGRDLGGGERAGRVAGVEPAFEDILTGLDQGAVPIQKVSSPEDIRKDLDAKLENDRSVILIVSDHKKVRVMELKQDPQDGALAPPVKGLPQ